MQVVKRDEVVEGAVAVVEVEDTMTIEAAVEVPQAQDCRWRNGILNQGVVGGVAVVMAVVGEETIAIEDNLVDESYREKRKSFGRPLEMWNIMLRKMIQRQRGNYCRMELYVYHGKRSTARNNNSIQPFEPNWKLESHQMMVKPSRLSILIYILHKKRLID